MVYPHEFCPSGFAKNLHLSDSISAKILAPGPVCLIFQCITKIGNGNPALTIKAV